jgi:glutamate racemase
MIKIGVFDSGIGGEAVAAALRVEFPTAYIETLNDKENVPYGDKTHEQVFELTHHAIQPFLDGSYDCIVLACNTATAAAIDRFRINYPHQRFIGIEPMVKTAAHITKSRSIAVCATPATLRSARYKALCKTHASDITVIEPDCSRWAFMIENNRLNRADIEQTIRSLCDDGADVIILGCTHYHWIKDMIVEYSRDRAVVLEPSEAIGRRVRELLGL